MGLHIKKKLVAVIVFNFLILLTATSVCNAQGYQNQGYQNQGYQNQGYQDQGYQDQGYQDSEWLDTCQNYLPTLQYDINQCQNAYNNNDMNSLSTYGNKMYNDCYNALEKSKPYKVSYKYTQIKTVYETCIYYYGLAGYYYNNNDYQTANNYMNQGKNSLASFKQLAAGL